ncbi:MAG: hypothetical protein QNL33_15345 [Akkermansiaceae bacterium]
MLRELSSLLRGAPEDLRAWIDHPDASKLRLCIFTIITGFGIYGLTTGLWRAPLMGVYVAIKMPGLIFITLICNGLLNGMLGLLLGSGLGFRQSLMAQLVSFSIAAMVLGAIAPVTFFMALNAPAADAPNAGSAHTNFLVTHTLLIAFAGVIANLHLAKLLIATTPTRQIAATTLFSWLLGNAFVGAQLSWILRPFFGTPTMKVAFLRDDPFNGTFYEVVWSSIDKASGGFGIPALFFTGAALLWMHLPVIKLLSRKPPENPAQ